MQVEAETGQKASSNQAIEPLSALNAKSPRKRDVKREGKRQTNPNSLANLKMFQPGNNMNPGGRPKGAKTRLESDFMWALADSFRERGKEAVEAVITSKPHEYLKIIAQLMPKEITVTTTMLDEMSLEQLEESLDTLRRLSNKPSDVIDVIPK